MANENDGVRRRHPGKERLSSLAVKAGSLTGPLARVLPDALVDLGLDLTGRSAAVFHPQQFWDVVTQTVLSASAGADGEYDKAKQVVSTLQHGVVPQLGDYTPAQDLMPFYELGQQGVLNGLAGTRNDAMNRALRDLYLMLLNDPALAAVRSETWFRNAMAIVDNSPDPTIVEKVLERMCHDAYGSAGTLPLRTNRGASPFGDELVAFTQEPRVLGLESGKRHTVFERVQGSIEQAIDVSTDQALSVDLERLQTKVHKLASPDQRVFGLSQASRQAQGADRAARGSRPANATDALRQLNTCPNTDIEAYTQARELAAQIWLPFTDQLADPVVGFETTATTADETIRQINQIQAQVAQMSAPIQAAFVEESRAAVMHILDVRPTQSAVKLYKRLPQVLDAGWRFLRERVQVDHLDVALSDYTTALDHRFYGVNGQFSIADTLQQEITALAQTSDELNPQTSNDFFYAVQKLKPLIQRQTDQAARQELSGIYQRAVQLLTHAGVGALQSILGAEPDVTDLDTAAQDAAAQYRTMQGTSATPEGEAYAGKQARKALQERPVREIVELVTESMVSDVYGLDSGTQTKAVAEADRSILDQLRRQLGQTEGRNQLFDLQARFLDVSEDVMLAHLPDAQSPALLDYLGEITADTQLQAGKVALYAQRCGDTHYLERVAQLIGDDRIGVGRPVNAVSYLQREVAALAAFTHDRDAEDQLEQYEALQALKEQIELQNDPNARLILAQLYNQSVLVLDHAADAHLQNVIGLLPSGDDFSAFDPSVTHDKVSQEIRGILQPVIISLTHPAYGLESGSMRTVAEADRAILAKFQAGLTQHSQTLPIQAAYLATSEDMLLDALRTSQRPALIDLLRQIEDDKALQAGKAYLFDERMGSTDYVKGLCALLRDKQIGIGATVSAADYVTKQYAQLVAHSATRDGETQVTHYKVLQQVKALIASERDQKIAQALAQVYHDGVVALGLTGETIADSITTPDRDGLRGILTPVFDALTHEKYGLAGGALATVAQADQAVLLQMHGRFATQALPIQAAYLATSEEMLLDALRRSQRPALLPLLEQITDDTALEAGKAYLFDARFADDDYLRRLCDLATDRVIGVGGRVSAMPYLNAQYAQFIAHMQGKTGEEQARLYKAGSKIFLDMIDHVSDPQTAVALGRFYQQSTDLAGAVGFLLDEILLQRDETRAQARKTVGTTDRDALEAALDLADEQTFGHFWEAYYARLASPHYGVGARAEGVAQALRANAYALLTAVGDRDFIHSGSYLKAAIEQAFRRIEVSDNADEQMRLMYWVMDLATTSPLAQKMKARDKEGLSTKASKTIGRILTEVVFAGARDPDVITKVFRYIETQFEGAGKDLRSKPEFVFLLALWRSRMLLMQPGVSASARELPRVADLDQYVSSTTAALEMSMKTLLSGDDTAWIEILVAQVFASAASMVAFADFQRAFKSQRKGTKAIREAAARARAEVRKRNGTFTEEFYAVYKEAAMAIQGPELLIPLSAEMRAIFDMADTFPELGRQVMDAVWRYLFDFSRTVETPPGFTYLTDPALAADPERAELARDMLNRQFLLMRQMVRDPRFNHEEVKEGVTRRLAPRAATLFMMWGNLLQHRDTVESDVFKAPLRVQYLELLGDVVFDAENRYAPEVQTAAFEVMSRFFYGFTPQEVEAFLGDLARRADHRSGHWRLVENGRWESIINALCLIPEGCGLFATDADNERGFRVAFAQVGFDTSVQLLKQWPTLAGPSPELIGSVIGAFVPPEALEKICPGQGAMGRQTMIEELGPLRQQLPQQVARLGMHFGPVDKKEQLAAIYGELATADLEWRATSSTGGLRPPQPVDAYIAASSEIVAATKGAIGRILAGYLSLIHTIDLPLVEGVEISQEGELISIPGFPQLTSELRTAADKDKIELRTAVGLDQIGEQATKIQKETLEEINLRDPQALAAQIVKIGRELTGDNHKALEALIGALEESGFVDLPGTTGETSVIEMGGTSAGALAISELIAEAASRRDATSQAASAMFTSLLHNQLVLMRYIDELATRYGEGEVAQIISRIRLAVLQRLLNEVQNKDKGALIVQEEEYLALENRVEQQRRVRKLIDDYNQRIAAMAEEGQKYRLELVKNELERVHDLIQARIDAAKQMTTRLKTDIPALITQYADAVVEPHQAAARHLKLYQDWLAQIGDPSGPLNQIAERYSASIAAMRIPVQVSAPTHKTLLERVRGPEQAERMLGYIHGLAADGGGDRYREVLPRVSNLKAIEAPPDEHDQSAPESGSGDTIDA